MKAYSNINEYIQACPEEIRPLLQTIRETIQMTAPEAGEKIAYGIPTFTWHGNLVHFAAYEHHIGFYPGAAPIAAFAKELKAYETSKGTVRFPIDQPLPLDLIKDMTLLAMERNASKMK